MDIKKITKEQAIKLIGGGLFIHTFRQSGFGILGCDWERASILEAFDELEDTLQLAGEQAARMGHGLAIIDQNGVLFIETIEEELELLTNNLNHAKTII